MPKELIRDHYYDHDSDAVSEGSQSALKIGWSKEAGHVEVATVAPDGMALEPTPEGNGWFVQLDRAGINRAIRTLRKARDDAFGRDA
jgi:hypothetical protein